MNNLKKIYLSSFFICFLKNLKNDLIFKNFINLLEKIIYEKEIQENIRAFGEFVYSLKSSGYEDFVTYLEKMITDEENIYDEVQFKKEVNILIELSKIDFQSLKEILCEKYAQYIDLFDNLPYFSSHKLNLNLSEIQNNNANKEDVFEKNRAFIFDNDFEIKPLELSENIKFSSLKGYSKQKKIIYDNTSAFLSGVKVNNILLYGDAGCGKSSSVRALLNEFEDIRIVQIFKKNLINLDKLYLKLKDINRKFIIFADDISFEDSDETFSTMKAIIEGSLIQCPDNAVIYATSNRRHLIRETFQTRSGDEIHLNDTMNEINSLSERFGINIFFSKPTVEEFNQIVIELAKDNNINIDEKTLIEKAKRLSLIKGTRSPRIAKQLIDNLIAHIEI